jgi:hypothetical protein
MPNALDTPLVLGTISTIIAGVSSYGLYRVIRPAPAPGSRSLNGRRVAAIVCAFVAFATLARAIARLDSIDFWLAVVLLTPTAWIVAFALGWILGPKGPSPSETDIRRASSLQGERVNENVKIAAIAAVALVAAVGIYSYFSPYNSCVRGVLSSGVAEYQAHFQCARHLGGSAG